MKLKTGQLNIANLIHIQMKKQITFLGLFLLMTFIAKSQTTVSGNITGQWTLTGSPYIVIGNITVVNSLIIDAGVSVQFNGGGWSITVGAGDTLIARGTCNDPVVFQAYTTQNPGVWHGLVFDNSGNDDSLFYCNIQSSTDGILVTNGSSTFISDCVIHHNLNHGIEVKDDASPYIQNCIIYENLQHGILCYNLNGGVTLAKIINCVCVQNCKSGIAVRTAWSSGSSHPEISNCTLAFNVENGLDVQQNVGTPDATIYNSILAYNGQYGIRKENGSSIGTNDVSYNCFWQNGLGQFYNLSGTGFGCAAQTGQYLNANSIPCDINFNICYDPLFTDVNCIKCNNGNYVVSSSNCINAATNIIFGQVNPNINDIGAFPLCPLTCTSPCPADSCIAPVGIDLIAAEQNKMVVNPNPGNGQFMVEIPFVPHSKNQLIVTNLLGEKIEEISLTESKTEINLEQPDGVYFLTVLSDNNVYATKVCIQR